MNILVAEPLAPAALGKLRSNSAWTIIEADPKTYGEHLADADALLVRSAVKVTADVLAKAPKLRVIGRAGVGVDNVDLEAATAAGVLVMNTPGGNAISVAEHTLAMMLSMARSVPQANASTRAGKWEKKKFLGNELRGKTLGIVGLGAIGREVVKRARPFEMKVVAYDPYVSKQTATDLDIELTTLPDLYCQSDFITLHVGLTPETEHLLNAEAFTRMKPGVRIVNCARGELVDLKALQAAMERGVVAGAGLDVFEQEPPGALPIFAYEGVVATPHIAGSTEEAQEIVGIRIVEQLVEYLANGVAVNAVNMPPISAEQYRVLGPFLTMAERLGTFLSHIASGNVHTIRLIYSGRLADSSTSLLRSAALAGVLSRSLEYKANLVNASQLADQRGFRVVEQREPKKSVMDSIRMELQTDAGTVSAVGAVVLQKSRLLQVDDIYCEATLGGHLMYSKNDDVPGVIGYLGTVLGENKINIANFALGREAPTGQSAGVLTAISIVQTDSAVPDNVVRQILGNAAVKVVRRVALPD